MPDEWETANGLNPLNATDRNTLNAEGYTMLEVYMNSLVAHIMAGGNAGGTPVGIGSEVSSTPKIVFSPLDPNGLTTVYTIDGRIFRSNVVRRYAAQQLPAGVYIVDKQKVSVK
jgi:hypothetical protein